MRQKTKICQNCKGSFNIELEDFAFYERIKVPPPTFCPECRTQRRLVFQNAWKLYRREDSLTGQEIFSLYSKNSLFPVYHYKTWWSDKWDALDYGQEYDFSRPFFGQFARLRDKVPRCATFNKDSLNSEYCSLIINSKNCYLMIGNACEDSAYSSAYRCKNCFDGDFVINNQNSYECIDCDDNYNLLYGQNSNNCIDSTFLYNCSNLQNCFGCVNLRNKKYNIFNEQCSKEEYQKLIKTKYDFGSYKNLLETQKEFKKFKLKFPRRFVYTFKSVNVIGDNIGNSKNCYYCFDTRLGVENCKYVYIGGLNLKDSYDIYDGGTNSELLYEVVSGGINTNKIISSYWILEGYDIQYSNSCYNSHHLFGCVGLRHKSYCILNKQYTKESFDKLRTKIIEHMNTMPYIDKKGRVYKYGEFFPIELSPFCYNETIAQEYFPLTKEEALKQGYSWKDPETKNYKVTITSNQLPDHIKDVKDDILDQTIECAHQGTYNEQCTAAFKIIPQELEFYRKMNLPLPRLCPNCRHYQRIKQRNPLKLWKRRCMCGGATSDKQQATGYQYQNTASHPHHNKEHCPNEFETTYAPERPEIVYCESCYNSEVV